MDGGRDGHPSGCARGWPYYAGGGYIGLWMVAANGTKLDDFGGGTLPQGSLPGGSLAAWWEEVKAWIGQVTGGGKVAAPAALKSQMAIRQRELTINDPPAGQVYRSYYFVGSALVAMREFTGSVSVVSYILTDHLGSTSMTLDASGIPVSTTLYKPWGETRYSSGAASTDYKYTGQMRLDIGIYFYGARNYDPYLNRWTQPDSIIPDPYNVLDWDRYQYVRSNPINFNDPTGHDVGCSAADPKCQKQNAIPSLPIKKPRIVSRQSWGAAIPGSKGSSEGLYDPVTNPSGYANYSDLYPDKSLAGILDTVVFHHEGNNQTYDIAKVQENEMRGGLYDIAYHYAIDPSGIIYEGRDIGVRGAHVKGANTGKVGILWLGDFEPGMAFDGGVKFFFDINGGDSRPSPAQIQASVELVGWLDNEYGIENAYGHQELNPESVCPGAYAMPYVYIFKALVQGIK